MQGIATVETIILFKTSSYSKISPIRNVSVSALKSRMAWKFLTEEPKAETQSDDDHCYSPSLENHIHQVTDIYGSFESVFCYIMKSLGSQKCQLCVVALVRTRTGAGQFSHAAPSAHLKCDRQRLLPLQPCLPPKLGQRAPGLKMCVTPRDHEGMEIKGQTSFTSKKKLSLGGSFQRRKLVY